MTKPKISKALQRPQYLHDKLEAYKYTGIQKSECSNCGGLIPDGISHYCLEDSEQKQND